MKPPEDGNPRAARPRQLPLDLDHRPGFSRDDLIVTACNREAAELIDRWPDWPSPVVVLVGPPGSGKSHLAAIWQARTGAAELDPAAIGEEVFELAGSVPLLIEDVGERHLDETGLFHLINAVRAQGSFLLMTSRRHPGGWPVRLPDLASRLGAATAVGIDPPDDVLLAGVVTKLFADRQLAVEPHVIAYMVNRIERSLSTAMRVVERMDRAALEQKSRITRALAAGVIGAMEEDQARLDL